MNVGESNSLPVVFLKDQCLVLNHSSYWSYAENLVIILHKITSKLEKIKRWFDINKLSINLTQIKETSSFSSLRILSKSETWKHDFVAVCHSLFTFMDSTRGWFASFIHNDPVLLLHYACDQLTYLNHLGRIFDLISKTSNVSWRYPERTAQDSKSWDFENPSGTLNSWETALNLAWRASRSIYLYNCRSLVFCHLKHYTIYGCSLLSKVTWPSYCLCPVDITKEKSTVIIGSLNLLHAGHFVSLLCYITSLLIEGCRR